MTRVNIQEIQPKAYTALFGLESYLSTSSIPPLLQELVRLRASQINGCSFCKNMHTDAAKKLGETDKRLSSLVNWRSSNLFDAKEQAVLEVTEAITLIADKGLSQETYNKVSDFLTEEEIAQLIMLIATINVWNRVGIATAA